ncbi:MAG TPA: DUF1820 family protein [Oligoflexia bacterium]|nr:DUF1820 family protein [Oligoflexia bacterium]HMR25389.1 DUF1820 family protein [Oligoflexia bacterium]
MPKDKTYYSISYKDPKDGTVLTLKARNIIDSSLGLGFVAISNFVFEDNKLVVTPDEEALMKRLENVKTLHLSIYSILSVCEMGEANKGLKFKHDKANVLIMPANKKS